MTRAPRRRDESGSAIADFVIVMIVLLPIVAGILQLALVLHVRNTLAAAASEGARYGAALDSSIPAGEERTREHIRSGLNASYADHVRGLPVDLDGLPGVEMTVTADVPALGLFGPGVTVTVHGTAVLETP